MEIHDNRTIHEPSSEYGTIEELRIEIRSNINIAFGFFNTKF